MGDILKDSRFSHIAKDARFRRIPKKERKVKIDKRFQSMFNDKRFQIVTDIDKRGRPVLIKGSEDLERYYDLSDESSGDELVEGLKDTTEVEIAEELEEENVIKSTKKSRKLLTPEVKKKLMDLTVDYARGEGRILTDSSSGEDTSDEDGDDQDSTEHRWGELDRDAETTEEATHRLALCNMDWDRITAQDLMVLFNSFLPAGGLILSVIIYPSEFGLKRMEEEDKKGPIELTALSSDDKEEEDSLTVEQREKLREYQLKRLKYFYAVLTFDSAATANQIYSECDGLEYESSMNRLDLRFIPDDTEFEQEPRETCTTIPDLSTYKPRLFRTTALTQVKVDLTWDETDPSRQDMIRAVHSGKCDNDRLTQFVALSSSDEEDETEGKNEEGKKNDVPDKPEKPISEKGAINKYKALLAEIASAEEKKKQDISMEVTWDLKLEQKTAEKVKEATSNAKIQTPFEQFLEKKKEKRKSKKEKKVEKADDQEEGSDVVPFSDDEIPSDIDLNDPYFKEEMEKGNSKKKKGKNKKDGLNRIESEEDERRKKELELLMMDELNDESQKRHFSLKKIEDNEKRSNGKKKLKRKQKPAAEMDNFTVDVKDERFGAIFTSHLYNVDPADPQFRATGGMKAFIQEKTKRRDFQEPVNKAPKIEPKKKLDADLNLLIKSVKRKTEQVKKKGAW